MTPDSITVLWTPVPAGRRGPRAKPVLSVLVSPRLRSADGTPTRCYRSSRRSWTGRRRVKALLPADARAIRGRRGAPGHGTRCERASSRRYGRRSSQPTAQPSERSQPDDYSKHQLLSYGVGEGLTRAERLVRRDCSPARERARRSRRHNDFARLVRDITGNDSHERIDQQILIGLSTFHRNIPAAQAARAVARSGGSRAPARLPHAGLVARRSPRAAARARAHHRRRSARRGATAVSRRRCVCVRPHFRASDLCPRVLAELDTKRFVAVPQRNRTLGRPAAARERGL